MTRAALVALGGLALAALAAPLASAQDARDAQNVLQVELEAPPALRRGDRTEIVVRVRGAGEHPVLVTPSSEGTAIEVVRGRLMRADAADARAEVLELRVPIVARDAGTAVVRVRVAGYACAARCRAVRAEASLVVEVAAAARGKAKQARTSSLSWVRLEGAGECVASSALARAVEARLGRSVFVSAAGAGVAVEGRAERTSGGWRAVIDVVDADGARLGERTLESAEPTCAQLGELAAVTIALMIDPLTAPEPEPAREPAPDPEPEPRVIVRTVEVPVPVEVSTPAPRWRVEVDATLVGSVGVVPTPMVGGLSTLLVEPPGFVPIAIEGALFPFSRADTANGHADFLHVHAGLQICPLWVRERGLALHGCVGADAGAVIVVGGDLAIAERERLIGQAHAAVRGHWDVIGPLTIRAALHLLVPFRHDPFVASAGGVLTQVYRPEPVAAMLDLGVGLHFD
ncbi:MAG: hypothetical protein KF729_02180 [Sandaracinaceae bacterium]|nr:hypothetical protein [Sandaracinaceae bacterium]